MMKTVVKRKNRWSPEVYDGRLEGRIAPRPGLMGQWRGESITLSRPQGLRPLAGAGRVSG